MKVFLDFEASSLARTSYPIEVAWVFEDGTSESHLIAPAPDWTDWSDTAQAIHGIARETLVADGTPHDAVARRMIDRLSGHDLFASAPSWDGKWLSALLRAAGVPRHALRLRDTDDALHDSVAAILRAIVPPAGLAVAVHNIVARAATQKDAVPAHRALADAQGEHAIWLRAVRAAEALAAGTPDPLPASGA